MTKDSRELIQIQIEALVLRSYIILYDELEKEIRHVFSSRTNEIDSSKRELLYFYLAGIKSNNIQIEYGSQTITTSSKFSSKENFAMLSMNQIIKIHRENHLLDVFDFDIQSINNKSAVYPFTDCCVKLLNMRNKLAHELTRLTFKSQDIIEILSNECIGRTKLKSVGTLDANLMTDETKSIFSNLVIMKNMLIELRKRAEQL